MNKDLSDKEAFQFPFNVAPVFFSPVFDGSRFKSIRKLRKWSFGWQRKRQSGGETHENAGAGPFQSTRANSDFELLQIRSAKSFPLLKRQTLIFLGHFLKKVNLREITPAVRLQLVVDSSSCVWGCCLLSELSFGLSQRRVSGSKLYPTPPPSIQQSILAALKVNPKRTKKQQWCTEESSHRELFVNAACFSSSKKRQGKGVGKAGSRGSRDKRGKRGKILQENKLGSVPVR